MIMGGRGTPSKTIDPYRGLAEHPARQPSADAFWLSIKDGMAKLSGRIAVC